MILTINEIKKSYSTGKNNEVKAVNGVSLEIGKGELVLVKGPSGCGKTTLLLIAGGLMSPDDGEVLLFQQNFYHLSPEERDKERALKIGFVFQQFYLIPYLNALENVLIPSVGANTFSDSHKERAMNLMERFKLANRIDHKPGELSTGERQRLVLARALINQPLILFADEPTGNLDDENAETVMSYINDFASEGGAVLLATHDQRISKNFQRAYKMKEGNFLK